MKLATIVTLLATVACSDGERVKREHPRVAAMRMCTAEIGCPVPIFPVKNLRASLTYYRDLLGFKIDWEYGEPPDFASVTRGDATIFIGTDRGGGSQLWVHTRDVDKLHKELQRRGAIIKMPPTNMPWGAREMHVHDLDGNLLRFGGPSH